MSAVLDLGQMKPCASYLGPDGGRPTQAVRHTCSGNLGIVKNIRSEMYTASATNSKLLYITQSPNTGPVLKHNGKSGTEYLLSSLLVYC